MATLPRRSPKLSDGYSKEEVRTAISILEDMPIVPEFTPSGPSDDGVHGQITQDANYVYLYFDGDGWARIARAW